MRRCCAWGCFFWMGAPNFCSFLLTATNGGRIPLLKFSALERDEGAPCAGVARGGVSCGRVPGAHPSVFEGKGKDCPIQPAAQSFSQLVRTCRNTSAFERLVSN